MPNDKNNVPTLPRIAFWVCLVITIISAIEPLFNPFLNNDSPALIGLCGFDVALLLVCRRYYRQELGAISILTAGAYVILGIIGSILTFFFVSDANLLSSITCAIYGLVSGLLMIIMSIHPWFDFAEFDDDNSFVVKTVIFGLLTPLVIKILSHLLTGVGALVIACLIVLFIIGLFATGIERIKDKINKRKENKVKESNGNIVIDAEVIDEDKNNNN